jgi:hypothetical protein
MRRPDSCPVDSPDPSLQLTGGRGDRLGELGADGVGVLGHVAPSRVSAQQRRGYRWPVAQKRTDVEGTARARGESTDEVLDRNLNELLQETRVATAGVQFLFAFLLTLPFTQRFGQLTAFHHDLYTVALMSTACAAIVLIAPVSFHRVLFRQHEKQAVVAFTDRALLVGLVLLLLSIASGVLLVLDVVLGRGPAVVGCAVVAALGTGVWFAVPGWRRARSDG